MKHFINTLKKHNINSIVEALLTSLFAVSFIELISSDFSFDKAEYFLSISLVPHIAAVMILFFVLLFVPNRKITPYLLLSSLTLLLFTVNCRSENAYTALISAVVLGGFIFYFGDRITFFKLDKSSTAGIYIAFGIIMAVFIALFTTLKYLSHWTPNFDFGIFAQMFRYMKTTGIPYTTCERDRLLSHFAVHFSPSLYLILPFYLIFESPVTLLVFQGCIVALGIIPIYLLCRHYKLSYTKTAVFAVIYALFPALINGNFYYFHENCMLGTFLLFMFFFFEKKKTVPAFIFAILAMGVKEDAPVYVAVFALYLVLSNKDKIRGTVLGVLSVTYFGVVTKLMSIYGLGIMSNRYENFIFREDGGLVDVIVNIFKNPAYVLSQIVNADKTEFIIYMFIPLALLPFIIKKPSRIILLIPVILVNLMTNYIYMYDIGFQYVYGSSAFLIYLSIMNTCDLPSKLQKKLMLCALFATFICFSSACMGYTQNYNIYKNQKEKIAVINEAISLIPDDASVTASTFLVAPLYDRDVIYQYEYTDKQTEYIVLDLRYVNKKYNIDDYIDNEDYEEVYLDKTVIAVFKKR